MKTPERICSIVLLLLACGLTVLSQEAPITPMERALLGGMLSDIKSDIKKNYYDAKFHGVDVEARFKEAADYLKTAKTYNQGIAILAWALKPLNDSHTFLIPPRRASTFSYGYTLEMVGDKCYATAVEPGGDAEKKGLKVGDQIVSLNRVEVGRETFWEIHYLFRILRPQVSDELVVRGLDGTQQTLNIAPKVKLEEHRLNYGVEYFDRLRASESNRKLMGLRSHPLGEGAIIWKMPTFMLDEKAIDEMIKQSNKFPTLILDLREDGGGSEITLLRLIGSLMDHEVKVGDRVMRTGSQPVIAKTLGNKAFHGKVIVLVDARSASASEIFARVMQLEKRATVLGDQTSGSVMEARFYFHTLGLGMNQGYGEMISHADLMMADGKSLEHSGVAPDELVLPTGEDLASNRDPVLTRAAKIAGVELTPEDAGKLFPIEWAKQ